MQPLFTCLLSSRLSPPLQNLHFQALPDHHPAVGVEVAYPLQAVQQQQQQQQQSYHPNFARITLLLLSSVVSQFLAAPGGRAMR